MSRTLPVVLTIIAVVGGNGCAIKPIPLTEGEVQVRVNEDRAVLTKDQEPLNGPVDLYEAMARALKYNLDARVELMHKMLAQTQQAQTAWAALLAAVGEDVLPNNLTSEQSLSDLSLQLRARWTRSKELLK